MDKIQSLLDENGVKDISIFLVPEMKSMALGDAKDMVANVLKGCLCDDPVKFTGINDRHFASTQ